MTRSHFAVAVAAALVLLLGACRTISRAPAFASDAVQLFAETAQRPGREWRLPQSGVTVITETRPVVDAASVTGVRVVSLDLGPALVIDLSRSGSTALAARLGASSGRLVLVAKGRALGIARVDGHEPFSQISLFVEMSAADLKAWAESIESHLGDAEGSGAK